MYKTIILPVLYGCETWSLILKEEKNCKYLRTKYLGKYLAQKRDEQTGEWGKLHNVKFHNLYGNADIIMLKSHRLQ